MKKRNKLLLLLLMISVNTMGQVYNAVLVDNESGKPIPYASIGFLSTKMGSATNENGVFRLSISEYQETDTLKISAIGYHSLKLTLSEALNKKSISLLPRTYEFENIEILDSKIKTRTKWLGKNVRPTPGGVYGASGPGENVGAAFAFRVTIKNEKPIRPLFARLFIKENKNDTLKIRCRFLEVDSMGKPGADIVQKNYLHIKTDSRGWSTCDFTEDFILLEKKDFFLVFEWLKETDGINEAPLLATSFGFKSEPLIRAHPFGSWRSENWAKNLVYSLKIEY